MNIAKTLRQRCVSLPRYVHTSGNLDFCSGTHRDMLLIPGGAQRNHKLSRASGADKTRKAAMQYEWPAAASTSAWPSVRLSSRLRTAGCGAAWWTAPCTHTHTPLPPDLAAFGPGLAVFGPLLVEVGQSRNRVGRNRAKLGCVRAIGRRRVAVAPSEKASPAPAPPPVAGPPRPPRALRPRGSGDTGRRTGGPGNDTDPHIRRARAPQRRIILPAAKGMQHGCATARGGLVSAEQREIRPSRNRDTPMNLEAR